MWTNKIKGRERQILKKKRKKRKRHGSLNKQNDLQEETYMGDHQIL